MIRALAALLALALLTAADLPPPEQRGRGQLTPAGPLSGEPHGVVARIKDIAAITAARSNQIVGYGLVVGLAGTGDSTRSSPFTGQSLDAMLTRLGIASGDTRARVKNVAAVIVTADLPPFAEPGSRVDVTVSSIGDATSLRGGTLVLTPLGAGDVEVYAVAQGSILSSGFAAGGAAEAVQAGVPTVARIPGGAIVEQAPPTTLRSQHYLLQLRNPDFSTAVAVTDAINRFGRRHYRMAPALERDARTVTLTRPSNLSPARFIAHLENLRVKTDTPARVVIDQRSGTVVIGNDVRVSRVAVSHGTLVLRVTEAPLIVQPEPFSNGVTAVEPRTEVDFGQPGGTLSELHGTDLQSLGRGVERARRRPGRHHRHPSGRRQRRRVAGGARGPVRTLLLLALLAVPAVPARAADTKSEIERFCTNIADPARERRYAILQAEAAELRSGIDARMRGLEARRAEIEGWMRKREAFLRRAEDQLVAIYASMRPDSAAERLALLDDALAAAIVMKLKPKRAALVLNEMAKKKAAAVSAVIAASAGGAS